MTMRRAVGLIGSATLLALVSSGLVTSSGASADGTGPSLAGRYTAMIIVTKKVGTSGPEGLSLKNDGRFVLAGRHSPRGTWTETADQLTLTGTGQSGGGVILTARVRGADLGSKAHPGEITLQGKHFAYWYAVPK